MASFKKIVVEAAASAVTALLRGGEPLEPQVHQRLVAANARREALEAKIGPAILDAELEGGAAEQRRQALVAELEAARAECGHFEQALAVAVERDRVAAAAAELEERQRQLTDLRKILDSTSRAAAEIDELAEKIVAAWARLWAGEELIAISLPSGCSAPRGYSGLRLEQVVGEALYRAHGGGISEIGDERRTFPGAKPSSHETTFNPSRIPTSAAVIGKRNDWLLSHAANQIGEFAIREGLLNEDVAA